MKEDSEIETQEVSPKIKDAIEKKEFFEINFCPFQCRKEFRLEVRSRTIGKIFDLLGQNFQKMIRYIIVLVKKEEDCCIMYLIKEKNYAFFSVPGRPKELDDGKTSYTLDMSKSTSHKLNHPHKLDQINGIIEKVEDEFTKKNPNKKLKASSNYFSKQRSAFGFPFSHEKDEVIRKIANQEKIPYDSNEFKEIKSYLGSYYDNVQSKKEKTYSCDEETNIFSENKGRKKTKGNDFISVFDRNFDGIYMTQKEFKNFLSKQFHYYNRKTFNPLQYIAIKYCVNNNINIPSTDNQKNFVLINDTKNEAHVVDSSLVNSSKEIPDDNGNFFVPCEDDLEYFTDCNDLNKIYKVFDTEGKKCYIRYPDVKLALKEIEKGENKNDTVELKDINFNPIKVSRKNLIPLTNISRFANSNGLYAKLRSIDKNKPLKIPTKDLKKIASKLEENKKISTKEQYTDDNDETHVINPFKLRELKQNKILEKSFYLPYTIVDPEDTVYYKIANEKEQNFQFMSQGKIISLLSNPTAAAGYNLEEMKMCLDPYNICGYLKAKNTENTETLVPKISFIRFIIELCENREVQKEYTFDQHTINVEENLLRLYHITPSPYFKDEILRDPSTTYVEKEHGEYELSENINIANDMYEYVEIKDIYDNNVLIRKPFIRYHMIRYKDNLLETISVIDSAKNVRNISLIEVLKGKKVSGKEHPNLNNEEYYQLPNGYFISRNLYNKCKSAYKSNSKRPSLASTSSKGSSSSIVKFFDPSNNSMRSMELSEIAEANPHYRWTTVYDENSQKIMVMKPLLNSLVANQKRTENEIYKVYDYTNTPRDVNVLSSIVTDEKAPKNEDDLHIIQLK